MKIKYIKFEPGKKEDAKEKFYQIFSDKFDITEAFFSLRTALEAAVKVRFGSKIYIQDFSNKEVVYRIYSRDTGDEIDAEGEDIYYRISYKIVKNDVELVGQEQKVQRAVKYEQLSTRDFIDLIDNEIQLKE